MKRTTLIKAVAGAGALFILGTGVAYAADVDATNKTTTTVTVTGTRTISLTQTDADGDFAVAGSMARNTTNTTLAPSLAGHTSNTYSLGFVTDYADRVRVTPSMTSGTPGLVDVNGITLHVKTGTAVVNSGAEGTQTANAPLTVIGAPVVLDAGLNGATTQVDQSFPLTFAADANYAAVIGDHLYTLTYSIGLTP